MYDIETASFVDPRYTFIPEFCPQNVRHRGQAFKGGKAGKYLQGFIDLYDEGGYRITEHRGRLLASLSRKSDTHSNEEEVVAENVYLRRNEDGSYSVSYLVKTAGTWSLCVTNEKFVHIEGSPFDVEITFGEVSADKSVLKFVEQIGFVTNYKEFVVQAKDIFGNEATEGGDGFVASCVGGGEMISLEDCKNGKYRVLCYVDETASFSLLKVTLFGKDIVNSPFDLTSFYKPSGRHQEDEPYKELFNDVEGCRVVYDKNVEIRGNFNALKDSLEKMQRETYTSYNAARLRVVHSIPAVFSINEPSREEQLEKRKQLVSGYRELNEQLVQIETNMQEMQNVKNELNDYLIEKSKVSRQLYKEALDEYNRTTGRILRLTRDRKRAQKLRKNVLEGDVEAFKRLEDERQLEETRKVLRESDQVVKTAEKPKHEEEDEDVQQEETSYKLNQTIPDRPNTLAFWLMEGRFRPPRKAGND